SSAALDLAHHSQTSPWNSFSARGVLRQTDTYLYSGCRPRLALVSASMPGMTRAGWTTMLHTSHSRVGMIIWSASRISQTPNFRQNDNIINFKIVTLHLNDAFCFDSCAPTTSSLSPTTPTKPPSPPPIPDPRSPQPTHERLLLSSGSFVPGARNRLSMDKQRAERRT
ncbi:hypothetical protein F4604DRAFT_2031095, partial [Suillus subluteus]